MPFRPSHRRDSRLPARIRHLRRRLSQLAASAIGIESLEDRVLLAAFSEFVDPNPNPDNQFGADMLPLSTGNVVVTSPFDDAGGTDAGAVYLFDGATGTLISTLTGSSDHDNVGSGGVTALSNGNFVIQSPNWDNGEAINAGAVTFGSGETGISGAVSASNSLIGTSTDDRVGIRGITALGNGNYIVQSPFWNNGPAAAAGAVTFGDGTTGVSGAVNASNSLVGTTTDDQIGADSVTGVTVLSNGNYVIQSVRWDNGAAIDAGAVTFGSGTTGIAGAVSASNSLVGTTSDDFVGNMITALTNGNYVVSSPTWHNGAVENAGAVTFGSGTTGVSGAVDVNNSLVGTESFDLVGDGGVTALSNGNYVAISPRWTSGAVAQAGAVTFGNGTTGIVGAIDASNSLVGSTENDRVGIDGVAALSNGNYVVISAAWNNGTQMDAGAVTFGDGTTGISGAVSASNSLVGIQQDDDVGRGGVTELTNGSYVVISWAWDNGSNKNAGAATFGDGATGVSGAVSASNSLVGTQQDDNVGRFGVTPLTNGNYVVRSPLWDNGGIRSVGAATFGDGTTGVSGAVSPSNSLVGTSIDDEIGNLDVIPLTNGNYVVQSTNWDNGAAENAGAVTFGDGTTGISGAVSGANSLIGTTTNDRLSNGGVTPLTNGNYVVVSFWWSNGPAAQAGAVTFGNGTTGVSGEVSASNSLVGSTANDRVGNGGVTELSSGNYVVSSGEWDNGAAIDAGAVTFADGTTGISGPVSPDNSLVGTNSLDRVGNGGITVLGEGAAASEFGSSGLVAGTTGESLRTLNAMSVSTGNYVVRSTNWDNGALSNAGAATLGNGMTGVTGAIDQTNSLVGMSADTNLQPIVADDANKVFFARFVAEENGKVRVGSQESPPASATTIIDDGDAGYSDTGNWGISSIEGRDDDVRFAAGGNGSRVATYEFSGLTPGANYEVAATWTAHANRATNAPYTILDSDGVTVLETTLVNQESPPGDFSADDSDWEKLAVVTVSGTTLTVKLSNKADQYVIADAVRVVETEEEPPEVVIIDDGEDGFAATAGWKLSSSEGRQNDVRYRAAGGGAEVASWTFTDLEPGHYRVSATWTAHANRATNAPFTILDGAGGTVLATTVIDQEMAPNDLTANGSDWDDLAIVTITGSELVVELSNAANGYVIADAIRIQTVNPPSLYQVVEFDDPMTGNVEQRLLFGEEEFHFATFQLTTEATLGFRPHPDRFDEDAWGITHQIGPFIAGAGSDSGGVTSWTVTSTDDGIEVSAAGDVNSPSGPAGSWSYSAFLTYDPVAPAVMGSSTLVVDLNDQISQFPGDLNIGRLASNFLEDFPRQGGLPPGDTGDTEGVQWTYDTSDTGFTHDFIPSSEESATFPTDSSSELKIKLTGNVNDAEHAGAKIKRAPDFNIDVISLTEGAEMTFAVFWDATQNSFQFDNLGATPLIPMTSTLQHFEFEQSFVSTPPETATVQVEDATIEEGDSGHRILQVPVRFVNAGDGSPPFSVDYEIIAGSATTGSDYSPISTSGTIQFTGQDDEVQLIELEVVGDHTTETNENLFVRIGNSSTKFTRIADEEAEGTILDDDNWTEIDDGDTGYADSGWAVSPVLEGRLNDLRYQSAGNGSQTATWTFTGLTPGSNYRVAATWAPHSNRATNAPFTISDGIGGQTLEIVRVDQEQAPDDFTDNGSRWKNLAVVTISGSELVVELSNDADEYVIADAVRIAPTTDSPTLPPGTFIDDGGDGFSTTPIGWSTSHSEGRDGDIRYSAPGSGSRVATWTFTGLTAGTYRVSATWSSHANRASDAPYTIRDGVTALGTVDVNQRLAPDDFTTQGSDWKDLMEVEITGDTLVVELSNAANGFVIADAIRIQPVT